jgi:hypothetical protein
MRKEKKLAIGSWSFPLVRGRARVKAFSVEQKAGGVVLKQPLEGSYAELFQTARAKPPFQVRLTIPSVFGRAKVVTIGSDWVQIGDRIFRAEKGGAKGGRKR